MALHNAGYLTAMVGKYLNRYLERDSGLAASYIPPGWSEWDVAGWGYPKFNYQFNENGKVSRYDHAASDYLTDVLTRRGVSFVGAAAAAGQPFFLELAPFSPHDPTVPAPRDAHMFMTARVPRPRDFDVLPTRAPRWLAWHRRFTSNQISKLSQEFRGRLQCDQSIDDMIGQIESALSAHGLAGNTYLVFSSDNGFHTGEYRLMPGKFTAFDSDIRVPLLVVGPGVPVGARTDAMTENVDLAETFAAIAGASFHGDGRSLLPLIDGQHPGGWRNAILVEHHYDPHNHTDPDFEPPYSGNPGTYDAMRTPTFLYVEYADGEREFYNLRVDPFELHNAVSKLTRTQRSRLHAELVTLRRCHGSTACWAATHVRATATSGRGNHPVQERSA